MKDIFKEPIKRLVITLVATFFIAISLIYTLDNYITNVMKVYDNEINNSKEKATLSKIMINKLFHMENYYLRIAHSQNRNEIENYSKGFESFSKDFKSIMHILTYGGVFEKKTKVRGLETNEIIEKIKYNRKDTSYILEIIELKPLLISVKAGERTLVKLVNDKIARKDEFSEKQKAKLNYLIKKISANYNRMAESIKRSHYNIAVEIQEIKQKKEEHLVKLTQRRYITITLVGLIISIITIIIFKKLSKLIRENKNYIRDIEENTKKIEINAKNTEEQNENLVKMIAGIKESSKNIAKISNQLSSFSLKISKRANKQALTSNEVANLMQEMLITINSNTIKAEITGKTSEKLAVDIKESSNVFIKTLDSVSEISNKISIINEIALKTDVLSINAAIEAARAGNVGKGFAVVAQEIRKLADKTKDASNEITELSETGQSISKIAADKLNETIQEISKSAKFVAEIVSASQNQQNNVKTINTSIKELANITDKNSESAKEMSISAEALSQQADLLNELISAF